MQRPHNRSRRQFLTRCASAAAALPLAGALPTLSRADDKPRPNVLLILSDDHRHDLMSCAGNPYIDTPHLDRIAAEGARFTNAVCCSGVCSPSRASIVTGKYAHRAAAPQIILDNHSFLENQQPFAVQLRAAGYHTAHFGKWHLGRDTQAAPGYDYWCGFDWVGNFFNQPLTINGEVVPQEGYTDDNLARLAAEHIGRSAAAEKPFYIELNLKAPHIPYSWPPRHEGLYDDIRIPKPESYTDDLAALKPGLAHTCLKIEEFPPAIPQYGDWDNFVRSYYRCAKTIDDSVGTVLEALDRSGAANDTLVLYTSDQGYSLGEHGRCEKHFAYEDVMLLPFLMRYPGRIAPGSQPNEMVATIDIAPTLLDYCGATLPEGMDGRSIRPLLEDGAKAWRDAILFEYFDYRGPVLPPQIAVRSNRYKYIEYQDNPIRELYDLQADPLEMKNLVDDPAAVELLNEARAKLEELKRQSDWKPRRMMQVERMHALGPIPAGGEQRVADAIREADAGIFDKTMELGKVSLAWKQITPNGGAFDFSPFFDNWGSREMWLALPIELLAPEDLHSILLARRADLATLKQSGATAEAWLRGQRIWGPGSIEKLVDYQLDKINPPLKPGENILFLRLAGNALRDIPLRLMLNARIDDIRLPLNDNKA